MFAVDTNVFVYAADRESEFHERAVRLLDDWRTSRVPWYTTWSVIYEFLRVTTHPRVFRKPWRLPDAWRFVDTLRQGSLEFLLPTIRHEEVAAATVAELPDLRGNVVHDLHSAVLLREHGIREIRSKDVDFHRFPFLDVVDPFA